MIVIIELDVYYNAREVYDIGIWCVENLGYLPESQHSGVAQCFKLNTEEDVMAFKLRWS